MNLFVEERYDETVWRLALGLEPIDALRGERIGVRLDVALDGVPTPLPPFEQDPSLGLLAVQDVLRRLHRKPSCRYVLRYDELVHESVAFRISDPWRRFVPRRLQLTVPTLKQVTDSERTPPVIPAQRRVRRPYLFPGAAYDVADTVTGMRGRVTRAGKPLRWARIVAKVPGAHDPIGRAHGDDRGEFLLVLGPNAGVFSPLPSTFQLDVEVTAYAPAAAPVKPADGSLDDDPLWDLPVEQITDTTVADDAVSTGVANPSDPGSASGAATFTFRLGRITSFPTPIAI